MCVSEGFPALPFFVNEDLTRTDGAITCRRISSEELLRLGWRVTRLLKILSRIPIEP